MQIEIKNLFIGYRTAGLSSEELMKLNPSDEQRFHLSLKFIEARSRAINSAPANKYGWANIPSIAGKLLAFGFKPR